jgi:hypothetical protein
MNCSISKRYFWELGTAMLAYGVTLAISIKLVEAGMVPKAWQSVAVLTPMLPCGFALWAILRQLGRLDELQRRVQLDAVGLAFAGTAMLTFGYGFLEGVGFPRLSMFVIWPVMAALWLIGGFVAARRYR